MSTAGEAYCSKCNGSFAADLTHCPTDGTTLVMFAPREDELIGRVLEKRYRIDALLGEGGMGAVYRGCQLSVDRKVAIKVVHPAIAAKVESAKRFLREARLASSLSAPGIVSVFDFGKTEDGILYLVMELIAGRSLEQVLQAEGPLDPMRVLQIALQLCDALETAHGAGIIHRDLKPGNILVVDTPSGELIKVLDFGIAKSVDAPKQTSTQRTVGTPLYMAPEQFEGTTSIRSDLYSVGCVLYELASGRPPHDAHAMPALFHKHLTEAPEPLGPSVPRLFSDAILRLLAKEPDERYQSAASLRAALRGIDATTLPSAPIIRTIQTPAAMPVARTYAQTPAKPVSSIALTIATQVRGTRTLTRVVVLGAAVLAAAIAVIATRPDRHDRHGAIAHEPPPGPTVETPPPTVTAPPPTVGPPPPTVETPPPTVETPPLTGDPVEPAAGSQAASPPKGRPTPPHKKPKTPVELPFVQPK